MRFALALMFIAALSAASRAATIDESLLDEIRKLAASLSDGPAYLLEENIEVDFATLPGTFGDEPGAVVLLTVGRFGGGHNTHQFLAAFYNLQSNAALGRSPDLPRHEWRLGGLTRVGQDFERMFDTVHVSGRRVTLSGKAWVPVKDAHCCPSREIKAAYEVSPYLFKEIPHDT